MYDRSDRPITCVSCSDLYFYRETCLKEGEDQPKSFFQTKLLSRKVCRILSSAVLLGEFTNKTVRRAASRYAKNRIFSPGRLSQDLQ